MTRITCPLVPVLLFMSVATADAAPLRLAPATAGDLAARTAVASDAPSLAPVGGPVRFAWPTDQSADDLDDRGPAHVAASTAWAATVDAAALRRGLALPVSRPGAHVQLSAQSGPAIDPRTLVLVDPKGVRHAPGAGLRPVGTAGAFTLDPALGAGTFTVRGETTAAQLRVDVREPDSDIELRAHADRDVVFAGDELAVTARLARGAQALDARVTARLVAPGARARSVALTRGRDGAYHGRLAVPTAKLDTAAPWTVEFTADATHAGAPVRRSAATAVAIAVPTARYTGPAAAETDDAGVRVRLELEVASPGRYAATATLYGTNREGALQPIAVGQSADQLAPGKRELVLEFDAATLAGSSLRAPFELRDLRLQDQGRMFVLHRQARGLALPPR